MKTSMQVLLLLAAVIAGVIGQSQAAQKSDIQASRRASRFQHLKAQFETFKRELDELMVETSNEDQVAPEPQVTDLEKRCQECDDRSLEKRCPTGCGKNKKPKTQEKPADANEPEATLAKKCLDCDDSSPEKRCPNGCSNNKKKPKKPVAEPEVSTADEQPAAEPQSEIMKRFLKALPEEDKRLVESSKSKRQFIERIIKRGHYGPNANDVAAEKKRVAEERVNAISNIGVRSMPSEDSKVISSYRSSLSSTDQQLLEKYKSKTRFIQGVLEKPTEHDKRDVDAPKYSSGQKRQMEDPAVAKYLEGLTEADKALIKQHPSVAAHLKAAIQKGSHQDQQEKRQLTPEQVQKVLSKLDSKEDVELVKQHLSKIGNLAEAQKKPVGNPEEEVEQIASRLVEDIRGARKRGYDLGKLLSAMKKRAEASNASRTRQQN